ncbi:MAG TPA: tubulin-like doman-containing protein [Ignavibacteria bacterium]|nr:tubulin-like doman-containing protein [Ignavibacteria bacterium]HRB01090.1 tubulin-like doman-containing protein [Ignavibacteria bacterium]
MEGKLNTGQEKKDSDLIMDISAKEKLELKTQELMPTILIGLGGTGKETLLRIRRQFVEKYGSINDFPIISYLYIDTDNAPSEESGIARERDYLINEIDFQPAEKIFHPVNPSDYIYRIQDVPHIKEWLSTTGEIAKLGTMNTGAGQIRPAARLAFFHNYDEIVSKLTAAKSRITDSKSINIVKENHKIKNVNTDKINVYVVTSLSGGTGSGMILDMGFLIRSIFRNQAVSTAYVVLPKIFQSYGKERVFANGYAALKELEHYNLMNTFEVSWKKNEPHKFQPGVFDDTYIIDGENAKNLSLSDQNNRDIYKMLADTIFQDFSNSDFANYKRGVRVNLVQYKQRLWPDDNSVTDNTYSRKYSALGQATISIPVDRIIISCAYKLCEEIINYYLTYAEGSQSEVDGYLINEFLPELGLLESKNKFQLLDSLYKSGEKTSLQSNIKTFLTTIQNDLVSGKRGSTWSSYLLNEKMKFDTNFKDDNDVNRQGMFFSQIHSNRTKDIQNLIGDRERNTIGQLERKINALVNDSTRGVFYAINLLHRLQFILTDGNFDYIPKYEKEIKDLQSLATKLDAEFRRRFQELKEDETRTKFNVLKKSAMSGSLEKVLNVMEDYYNTLIKLKSRYYAREICLRILSLIETKEKTANDRIISTGLIPDLNKLTGNLGTLKNNFRQKFNHFIQKQETSFNLMVYEPDEVSNEYYVKYIGTGQTAFENIKNLSNKLLKDLGASDVTDIVNILRERDAKLIESKMLSFARKQFENIREDYNITDILFEKDSIRSESKIRGMFNQAFPWMRTREIPGSFKLDESAKKFYIGIKTNTPSFKKFQTLIQSIAGSSVEFKDSADNSSITFYSEWAGFPLFYSYTIAEEMKPYYKQLSQNHNVDLHINKNYFIYNDIIPLNDDEKVRLDEAYKAYLLGLIFGIFDVIPETETSKAIYKYTKQEGITVKRVEQLGVETRLINRLFEEQGKDAMRYRILKDAEAVQDKFFKANKLAEMLAIYEYYYDEIYKPVEYEISGDAKRKVETYQYSILRNLSREIENKISLKDKDQFVDKVISFKRNPDSYSRLIGDGGKRVLRVNEILSDAERDALTSDKSEITISDNAGVSKNRLKEFKEALDEGLITNEEFEKAKKEFLKI